MAIIMLLRQGRFAAALAALCIALAAAPTHLAAGDDALAPLSAPGTHMALPPAGDALAQEPTTAPVAQASAAALAIPCKLAQEDGYGGFGEIFPSFRRAPKSLVARACKLKRGASIPECGILAANCSKLALSADTVGDALAARPSLDKLFNPTVTDDVLAAAFTTLETGKVSAATPAVALATACALANSRSLLRDACSESEPCSTDWVYEKDCLNLFRDGKSDKLRPGTDCCKLISSPCLCEMKKTIIKEGKKLPTGCLNPKELAACKP